VLAARASEIELSWPPAGAGAQGELSVERRAPGGSWAELARLPLSATRFTDSGLTRTDTWCYRVRLSAGERVRTHAAEHCVGPKADPAPPASRRTRVRGGWLQEVEP
jgi:hypothetical protein